MSGSADADIDHEESMHRGSSKGAFRFGVRRAYVGLRRGKSVCWTETEEFPVRRNREAHFFGSAESVRFRRMALSFPETKEWLLFIGFVIFFYETEE